MTAGFFFFPPPSLHMANRNNYDHYDTMCGLVSFDPNTILDLKVTVEMRDTLQGLFEKFLWTLNTS